MKILFVSALALWDDKGRLLITERPEGKDLGGFFEFPGGKIEPGETPEAALVREIKEELGIALDASALTPVSFVSYPYEKFHVVLFLFSAVSYKGKIRPQEGQSFRWATLSELGAAEYPLVPADREFLKFLQGP